jgi:hypothetical protein
MGRKNRLFAGSENGADTACSSTRSSPRVNVYEPWQSSLQLVSNGEVWSVPVMTLASALESAVTISDSGPDGL